ncbi:MAG TPA: DUF262 domain-containing protein [Terriglobales bacterium]|nr:DUF262 domain-containing protein [Terriglobales bacterium]
MPPREATKLNLDALIARQDMAGGEQKNIPQDFGFKHSDLLRQGGMTYAILKKPDFQRSTSFWGPEKVLDMVVAYIENQTVPAIIVWRSPESDLFVIDGAHRLSSIIAWINDDYGDGKISKDHYGEPQNPSAAQKARDLINLKVGSYQDLIKALNDPNASAKHQENAKKLVFASLPSQELKKVNKAELAERSFLKINEQGVILSETEKWLINSRFCPNAIAARAISLKGTGGAYWERFSNAENKKQISELGASVHKLLFTPDLDIGELKTVDLPIAGSFIASNALTLIFQLVNFANDVPTRPPSSREEAEKIIPADTDGTRTIECLKKTKRTATLLTNLRTTNHSHSVDLHPFVYFYSRQGNHQPTMFLATAYWLRELDKKKKMTELAKEGLRGCLEEFLLENSFLVAAISRRARGEEKAVRKLKKYLDFLTERLSKGIAKEELLTEVGKEFRVSTVPEPDEDEEPTIPGSRIPIHVKNAMFIDQELQSAQRCEICKARIPARGLSRDHRQDKKHGGIGTKENAAPTHHACNSAKDKIKKATAKGTA